MKDKERERFHIFFGVLFPVSDAMVQKCWMKIKPLPLEERAILIDVLGSAALRKIDQDKENAKKNRRKKR